MRYFRSKLSLFLVFISLCLTLTAVSPATVFADTKDPKIEYSCQSGYKLYKTTVQGKTVYTCTSTTGNLTTTPIEKPTCESGYTYSESDKKCHSSSSGGSSSDSTASQQKVADAVYGSFNVDEFRYGFNDKNPGLCSTSQVCDEAAWRAKVYECWTTAESTASGNDSAVKSSFASCIATISGADVNKVTEAISGIDMGQIRQTIQATRQSYCEESGGTWQDGTCNMEAAEGESSCGIEGIGWIVCPVMGFVADINDAAYEAIGGFLRIKPRFLTDSNTQKAWEFFRNVANLLFAVAFLWLIFSQISNVGLSNYGIKRLLPRLIIGAILVNLSYFICQIAVDLSNILGNVLEGVFDGVIGSFGSSGAESGGEWAKVIGAGIAIVGALAFVFLAVGVPVIFAALLVVISVVAILIVRQVLIILLVAISPLAFAAWLLPNTEGLFKKWMSIFRGLLVVFPVVALLFGAGKLASAIIMGVASGDTGGVDITLQLSALGATILPLGTLPFVLQGSLKSIGNMGGMLGGLSRAATKRVGGSMSDKFSNSRIADFNRNLKTRTAMRRAKRRAGNSFIARKGREWAESDNKFVKGVGVVASAPANLGQTFDNSRVGRFLGQDRGAAIAQAQANKQLEEDAAKIIDFGHGGDEAKALKKTQDKHVRALAMKRLATSKGTYGAEVAEEYLRDGGVIDSMDMAEAMTKFKPTHAGVAAVGVRAQKILTENPNGSFSLGSSDELDNYTRTAYESLSNTQMVSQAPSSIEHSGLSPEKAKELMKNKRIRDDVGQKSLEELRKISEGNSGNNNSGSTPNEPQSSQ